MSPCVQECDMEARIKPLNYCDDFQARLKPTAVFRSSCNQNDVSFSLRKLPEIVKKLFPVSFTKPAIQRHSLLRGQRWDMSCQYFSSGERRWLYNVCCFALTKQILNVCLHCFLWRPFLCLYIWTTDEAGVSTETERLMQIIYRALLPALLLSVSLMEPLHLAPLASAVMFLGVPGGSGTRFLFFDLEGSPERMH